MNVPPALAERHLVALWASIREAADAAEEGRDQALLAPELATLRSALAASARRLAEALDAGSRSAPASLDAPAERPAVLLVDDDPAAVSALASLLSDEFQVTATIDPEQVPRLVRDRDFEAVVTDLRMPGLDGLALLELLSTPHRTGPAVLVVSGNDDVASRLAAFAQGAFDFISKPVDVSELGARLWRAVKYTRDLKRARAGQELDALTGLFNRRGLDARLLDALSDRRHGHLALALLDQDGLKGLNDRWGHAAGDLALQHIAAALKANQRGTDTAARFGGDEFALLMPDTTAEGGERLLERVQRTLQQHPLEVPGGELVELQVSFGVAEAEPGDRLTDGATLFARADASLYAMKRLRHRTRSTSELRAQH